MDILYTLEGSLLFYTLEGVSSLNSLGGPAAMSFLLRVTSSAFLASLPPILSAPNLASCLAFNLLMVSSVSSDGVKSLFSPLPELAPAPGLDTGVGGAGLGTCVGDGFAAGVGFYSWSSSIAVFVLFDELELFDANDSLLDSFFFISIACFLGSDAYTWAGVSSFFLQLVIEHQSHIIMSSIMNIY